MLVHENKVRRESFGFNYEVDCTYNLQKGSQITQKVV